jgi:hypothetical protein
LLFLFRDDLDEAVVEVAFGHSISIGLYLIGFSLLTLTVGFVSSFLGATSREDEELTAQLLVVPSRHWLWLWTAGSLWIGMLPIVAYYIWLQFATAFYSIIHPSLWFQEGTDLFLGSLGIAALFIGIDISLKAVSDKRSYGAVVWKRVLTFLAGSSKYRHQQNERYARIVGQSSVVDSLELPCPRDSLLPSSTSNSASIVSLRETYEECRDI